MTKTTTPRPGPRHQIQQVARPELFEDQFPWSEIPKVRFDGDPPRMALPDAFWVTDTTFRDGQQSRPPFTVQQIVDLFRLENKLSGPNGVLRMSEFFLYTEKDREAVKRCQDLGFGFPHITSWIRAHPKDVPLVKAAGVDETGILTSVSDYHIFLKLKKSRTEVAKQYLDVVEEILRHDIVARCHFEDLTRADFPGFVLPFAQSLLELSDRYGLPVKMRLCDTMGYGVPYAEAALPRSVPKIVRAFRDIGVPAECLEWHGHNDFWHVHSNSMTAWLYGAASVNGTLLAIGERTGNTPLEAAIIEYIELKGHSDGVDTTVITEIKDYFEKVVGETMPVRQPFVGRDFNTTRAGIHIDATAKDARIYTIFDAEKLLRRGIGVTVTEHSGAAGVAYWINDHYGLSGKDAVTKQDPRVADIVKWVGEEYAKGRTTSIADPEMETLVEKHFPHLKGHSHPHR